MTLDVEIKDGWTTVDGEIQDGKRTIVVEIKGGCRTVDGEIKDVCRTVDGEIKDSINKHIKKRQIICSQRDVGTQIPSCSHPPFLPPSNPFSLSPSLLPTRTGVSPPPFFYLPPFSLTSLYTPQSNNPSFSSYIPPHPIISAYIPYLPTSHSNTPPSFLHALNTQSRNNINKSLNIIQFIYTVLL